MQKRNTAIMIMNIIKKALQQYCKALIYKEGSAIVYSRCQLPGF